MAGEYDFVVIGLLPSISNFFNDLCGGSDGTRTRGLWRDSLAPVLYLRVLEGNIETFFPMLMVTEGN